MRVAFFGNDSFSARVLQRACRDTAHEWHVFHAPRTRRVYSGMQSVASLTELPARSLTGWSLPGPFDVGVVASFGYFVPARIVSAFPRGMLNVHPSLLPQYRGPAPIHRAILEGSTSALGVSVIDVHPRQIDAGDVWAEQALDGNKIARLDYCSARDALADLGGEMVADILRSSESLAAFANSRRPQCGEPTHAPKVTAQDGALSATKMSACEIDARWRALSYGHALKLTTLSGKAVQILDMSKVEVTATEPSPIYQATEDNFASAHLLCGQQSMNSAQFDSLAASCLPGAVFYDRRTPALWVMCGDRAWVGVISARICGTSQRRSPGELFSALSLANFASAFL